MPYEFVYKLTNFRNHFAFLIGGASPAGFDPELGWIPKQGVWGHNITILEDGVRSNGGGELRDWAAPILAVGDSFTFGSQVADWETWPAELEKLIGRKVVNGGVFGYGIDQAFLRARRLLSQHRFSAVIFSFIAADIYRSQLSEGWSRQKPYFDFKDGRLTLENVPVPPPSPLSKENALLIAMQHSQLLHSVMSRLFPEWWSGSHTTQVHDDNKGREVACALLHELEALTKSHGTELIVLIQYMRGGESFESDSRAIKSVLRCISDPATRVLDTKQALFELKAEDPSRYERLYNFHMTAEGNRFVALETSKLLTRNSAEVDQSGFSPPR